VRCEIAPDEVESCYVEVIEDFSKKAKLPGFRQGKVPANMIESAFADSAKEEVIKKMVSRAYAHALETHQAHAMSMPTIKDLSMERGKKMTFTAEFDTAPIIKLKRFWNSEMTSWPKNDATHRRVARGLSA